MARIKIHFSDVSGANAELKKLTGKLEELERELKAVRQALPADVTKRYRIADAIKEAERDAAALGKKASALHTLTKNALDNYRSTEQALNAQTKKLT